MLFCTIDTPIGPLYIAEEKGNLTQSGFGIMPGSRPEQKGLSPLLAEAQKQFLAYFEGSLQHFNLPLAPTGTEFQKNVWDALTKIPYGTTATYGEVAAAIGNAKACRAVGGANNKNPLGVIIPCHRVIGADKSLVGYAGGLHIKQWLLAHEAKYRG